MRRAASRPPLAGRTGESERKEDPPVLIVAANRSRCNANCGRSRLAKSKDTLPGKGLLGGSLPGPNSLWDNQLEIHAAVGTIVALFRPGLADTNRAVRSKGAGNSIIQGGL